jgi:hypothetical protein
MEKFAGFIRSLGGLHDAEIISLSWTPGQAEIRMSVDDINSNFDGLPEYEGLVPGVFVFSGVTDVGWAVDRPDPRMKIYDWDVVPITGGTRSEIKISPSGQLIIQCAAIVLAPNNP